jgi:hypothetical protein
VRYGASASWFASNDGIQHQAPGATYNPLSKIAGFTSLVNGLNGSADVAMLKFCVSDSGRWSGLSANELWTAYNDAMGQLTAAYPGTEFVYWTMPIGNSTNWDQQWHSDFNTLVRAHCASTGVVLFDIAAVESDNGRCAVNGYESLCSAYAASDGAHLSEAGQAIVAAELWEFLGGLAE